MHTPFTLIRHHLFSIPGACPLFLPPLNQPLADLLVSSKATVSGIFKRGENPLRAHQMRFRKAEADKILKALLSPTKCSINNLNIKQLLPLMDAGTNFVMYTYMSYSCLRKGS